MESKKTNRKLNSYFWYILYILPLLILLVLFIGYLSFYNTTGADLVHKDVELTVDKEVIREVDYDLGNLIYNGGYIENLYFNTNFTIEDFLSLDSDIFAAFEAVAGYVPLFVKEDFAIIMSFDSDSLLPGIYCLGYKFEDDSSYLFIADDSHGWNPLFDGTFFLDSYFSFEDFAGASFETLLDTYSDILASYGDLDFYSLTITSDLLYYKTDVVLIPESVVTDSYFTVNYFGEYISLFDYSLIQSLETFDGFVVPVLSDGLNTVFGYLNLDITTLIARFVILLFTWMIQIKFIHIVVDLLSFVPDLYHDFTNGKRC